MSQSADPELQKLQSLLRVEIEAAHGPLLTGSALVCALGFRSSAALRQARRRGQIPVLLFSVPHRRGLFALTRDVADWLAMVRTSAATEMQGKEGSMG